jgi:hypothetical protein
MTLDISKVGTVLDNLKMDPTKPVMKFATKINSSFSQLRELIPQGQIVNIPANPADRTNNVCGGIHDNTIQHMHHQYLKYFFVAGLPKTIMQLIATKDPPTFTEAHNEATRVQELTKARNNNGSSANAPNIAMNPSIKLTAMEPEIRIGVTLKAPDAEVEVLHKVQHLAEGVTTMVEEMEMEASRSPMDLEIINTRILINKPVCTVPFPDTVKNTAVNESERTNPTMSQMEPLINHLLAKTKIIANWRNGKGQESQSAVK